MPDIIEAPAAEPDYFANLVREIETGKAQEPAVVEAPPVAVVPEEAPPAEVIPETPVTTEEEDDIDSIKPAGDQSKVSSEHWDKLKATSKNYKAKSIAAEAAILEKETAWQAEREELVRRAEEASATSGELVELRERREAFDAAEKEFTLYNVTKTAEYRKTIEAPLQAIEARVKAIAKKAEVSADTLLDAISELDDDKQAELLETAVAGLSQIEGSRILRMAEDARGLILRDIEIRENAAAAQKELKEREEKEAVTRKDSATKEYKASVKNTVESLIQRLPFVELAEGETKEGVFKSILDKAEAEDFDSATATTKGTAAVSVIALERATRQLQKQDAYIKTLEARVKESTAAAPNLGGGNPPPAPPAEHTGGFMDGINDALGLKRDVSLVEALAMSLPGKA